MKQCKNCKELKEKSEFYSHIGTADGLRPDCKKCFIEKCNYNTIQYRNNLKDKYGLGAGTIARFGLKLALEVYDRVERKCETCGQENDLTIHHKDHKGRNYENQGLKPNDDIDNLIVLCRSCHGRIHGKQGKGISKTFGSGANK